MIPIPPRVPDARIGKAPRLAATTQTPPRRGQRRAGPITPLKTLITAASLATTVAGWALFAQHDAAGAAQ
ncbi:MAG TPA: hypothetical protein VKY74_20735, partial [Chloroflexia bacterium]|nr:hypothetical protein [Chloroflexia bacterium]